MKRILNIITSIHDGGLERHVFYIISFKKSEQLEHYLAVLTPKVENTLTEKYSKLGIKIKYFNFDNRLFSYKSIPKNIIQVFKLSRFIKNNKIDVIHSHDFFPAFVSRVSAIFCFLFNFYKVKRIYITLHIVFLWLNPLHNYLNKLLSRITTKIVCLSNAIKNYSLKHDKIKIEKYVIINTGVDTNNYIPNPEIRLELLSKFNYSDSDFIIGNIGVLSIRKGQIYLLKAINKLKDKYPFIKLMIIGGERKHEKDIANELYNYIDNNKLNNIVKIIPPRDDVNLIYNIFDIFAMPSITEGLSACAIEALLMERICLFSDIEPFKELVEDGLQGYLFENKNSKCLEQKLDFIIQNYQSIRCIGINGRESVKAKYDVRDMVNKYEKLYLN